MIKITYPPGPEVEQVEQQLKTLSLAYQKEENPNLSHPTLSDGIKQVEGLEAIQQYLEELSGELGQWYYCSC